MSTVPFLRSVIEKLFAPVLGHSGTSIGAHLGISQTTVKSHRQNLYGKLGIASQFELFSQFLQSLSPLDS